MTTIPHFVHQRHERMHEVMLRDPVLHARSLRRKARKFEAALPGLRWQLRTANGDMERSIAKADVAACLSAIGELTTFAELEEQRAREDGQC